MRATVTKMRTDGCCQELLLERRWEQHSHREITEILKYALAESFKVRWKDQVVVVIKCDDGCEEKDTIILAVAARHGVLDLLEEVGLEMEDGRSQS